MASDLSFMNYVFDQLRQLDGLTFKKMFGEFAVYHHGKVFGFVCDNQLYIKPTEAGRSVMGMVVEGFPYPGAKPHLQATELIENSELLTQLVLATSRALPEPVARKKKSPRPT
jgi:TfoX/Sxy family transcriptional regulator of competence genes